MKKIFGLLGVSMAWTGVIQATPPAFTPGQLAVLQLGTGGTNQGATADDIWASRQNPYFVDQFDPNGVNQTIPSYQVAIPTNGPTSLWVNGNAGTEGNLTLSADRSLLTFAGYCGDICSIFPTALPTPPLAPSNLNYDRGIGTVDAFGNYQNPYRGPSWYGIAQGKTNPRGVAADGAGRFWGCGNGYGSLFYNASTSYGPIVVQNLVLTGCAKILNGALYSSVKSGADAQGLPAGIYSFVDFNLNPYPLPTTAAFPLLQIPADAKNQNCVGFDINPPGNVAYVADTKSGICKYVKSGPNWKMVYYLTIPGYTNWTTGIRTNPASIETLVGCFSVTVDWSGTNPVVYATTGDSPGADPRDAKAGALTYYANRVIRINDTNTATSGSAIVAKTNILTTVVQAPVFNPSLITNNAPHLYIVYKSVAFAPDLRPLITNNPVSWSAVAGDAVSFSVGAASAYPLTYQWQTNGINYGGQTSPTLNLGSVALTDSGTTFRCLVSNDYGSVTSAVATLTVLSSPTLPTFNAINGSTNYNLTNYVGNNFSLAATVGGTDPKGGYQWYSNSVALSDVGEFSGTQTSTLNIVNAQTNDSAVYSLTVTNRAGSTNQAVVNLRVTYAPPQFIEPPIAQTVFRGQPVMLSAQMQGYLLTNTWYTATSASSAKGLTPISLSGRFSQTDIAQQPASSTLVNSGTVAADATNYVLVVSNPSGAITSAPIAVSLYVQPASHSFASYSSIGQNYTQDFDSLPVPGGGSFEAGNPIDVTFVMTNFAAVAANGNFANATNSADITYSLDDPADFGYPVIPAGAIGGLGLSNTMAGWYGWSQKGPLQFSVTSGDQSQAAVIDNGLNFNNINGYTTETLNRALGLLTSTKSGMVAYGVALINNSGRTLNQINLRFTGELWRNNPLAQPLTVGYLIDPGGTSSSFPTNDVINGTLSPINDLTVSFPTSLTTEVLNGTLPANQTNLAVSAFSIADWAPGSTLWLVWQAQTTAGGAQDVAIDNVSLSATPTPVAVTQPVLNGPAYANGGAGAGLTFHFTNSPGADWQFTIWGTTNLAPASWQYLGHPTEGPAGQYQFTDSQATNKPRQFYKVTSP
ncbi:MAG TPA: immunoglobulin domain-containing protein [Candidatus Acidoferrum sp.]|nr:immunoglobulin domain-containing protein [Candidatus Acidoferrum sp.]